MPKLCKQSSSTTVFQNRHSSESLSRHTNSITFRVWILMSKVSLHFIFHPYIRSGGYRSSHRFISWPSKVNRVKSATFLERSKRLWNFISQLAKWPSHRWTMILKLNKPRCYSINRHATTLTSWIIDGTSIQFRERVGCLQTNQRLRTAEKERCTTSWIPRILGCSRYIKSSL